MPAGGFLLQLLFHENTDFIAPLLPKAFPKKQGKGGIVKGDIIRKDFDAPLFRFPTEKAEG